ncbi:MAG: oligosaccharide flippase family protein [Rubrobacter sp.]|nr:oligosaccharide flippase family protein [Rubrobacter sp.]
MNTDGQALKTTPMELVRRRLLSGGAWSFGGKILIAFIGLISNALLARLLTPQDLGAYFLAYSIVNFGAVLGTLGSEGAAIRLIAEGMGLNLFGRVRRVIGALLGVGTLGALSVGLAYLLYGDTLGESVFNAPALAAVSGLVAGWIVVATLQGLLGEIFRGFHDIRLYTLLGGQLTGTVSGLVTIALVAASLVLLWLVEGQATLATVLLLAICSGAVSALLAGWLLHRKMAELREQPLDESQETDLKKVFGEAVSIAWPLLITSIVMLGLRYGDIWVLGAFGSQEEVAVYGAAVRLVSMVTMPLIIMFTFVPPLIAEMYAQGRRDDLEVTIRALATLTGIPGFLASVVCIVFASPILGLVYGDYYREGAMAMALLSVGLLTTVWTGSGGYALMMTGHQKTYMVVTVGSGVVTFVAMVAAVGPYGITGVAVGRLAGWMLQNVLTVLMAKQKTGMWIHPSFRIADLLRIIR